jgi:16S rRNA G966 N2-methylase RsmD
VEDCVFFDLFAGSGAVGLEALSRGAARAIFVESGHSALASIRENLGALGCKDRASCLPHRLPGWLRTPDWPSHCPAGVPVIFFLDPPFREGLAQTTMEALGQIAPPTSLLSESQAPSDPGGIVLCTCAAQTERQATLAETYGTWRLRKCYPHGDSALWVYDAAPADIAEQG